MNGFRFDNAMMMLNLEICAWQQIDLPNELISTCNPLEFYINHGILIFTDTHIRSPIIMRDGDGDKFEFIDDRGFKAKWPSSVYRIAFG
jgi:hypothetical protein